jgi:cytochrome P450/NADPH-cytochrome P450 reductase
MSGKKTIFVVYEGKRYGVSFFPESEPAAIERACAAAISVVGDKPLNLVDEGNNTVALCSSLPDGIVLTYSSQPISHLITPKGPKPLPGIGNMKDLMSDEGMGAAYQKLIDTYGSMVFLQVPNHRLFVTSDADVIEDMVKRPDEFQKKLLRVLKDLRASTTGDGLFTCNTEEEIWEIAHRILMPGFTVQAIKQYYQSMLEVADELIAHLEAIPSDEPVLITDWMTRMTFEAISKAGFSTQFHSMDQKELPPFVEAMVVSLVDAMQSVQRALPDSAYAEEKKKREKADKILHEVVDDIVKKRREKIARGEAVPNDLLQIMLTGKDRATGKHLPDDNICNQLITFLIAGHETTSGLLSYAIYYLMTNPDIERKLIEEVDAVLGRDFSYHPTYEDLEHLPCTLRILKETLRLNPTAPFFSLAPTHNTVLAGKYSVEKGDLIVVFVPSLHHDPKLWGNDVNKFDPDRFLSDATDRRHPDAYHPCGVGVRSCIGFQFSLKEATMVLARLYQRFRFSLKDKNYQLKHVETLTVKPKDLYVLIDRRAEEKGKFPVKVKEEVGQQVVLGEGETGAPLLFLFGSNMGCCQELAHKLAQRAQIKGYHPIVKELDEQVDKPWESAYVAIIASTYNGLPPDNAAQFEKWISHQSGSPFSHLNYTVLGVGNKQWHATFVRFPTFIDARMKELGANCFFPMGIADVDGDSDSSIEAWARGAWQKLQQMLPAARMNATEEQLSALSYACEITNYAGSEPIKIPHIQLDLQSKEMVVIRNEELTSKGVGRSVRHIEIRYPEGCTYHTGDHLGVLPENSPEAVAAAAKLCALHLNDVVIIKSIQNSSRSEKLPIGIPLLVKDLLTEHVDLEGPVSRDELRLLAFHCPCPTEKAALEEIANVKFVEEILEKERTFIEICKQFQSIRCSLEVLLSARPVLKPRYYSISSSPLVMPKACTITVSVHEYMTRGNRHLQGVCSNYLSRVQKNTSVRCFIKDTKSSFRLPEDPTEDMILIGPGTGVAPFRGFLQERQRQKENGVAIGKQLLFFGCRHPDQDYIYQDELEEYKRIGLLQELFVAFSRLPDRPKCYVQDLLRENSSLVWEYIKNNARVFVCGEGKHMAPAVRSALIDVFKQEGKLSQDEAQKLLNEKQNSNFYVEDVWAG